MNRSDTRAMWKAATELSLMAYQLGATDAAEKAAREEWMALASHLRRIVRAENKRMKDERAAARFQAQYDEGDYE